MTTTTNRAPRVGRRLSMLRVNVGLGVLVWATWAVVFGDSYFTLLAANWPVAVTMFPGSLVGGGTSEGGGAVAFPVLTKVLAVPADEARVFTFAIQTIGMGCAAISILATKVPIEKRAILWCTPPAIVATIVTIVWVAPAIPLPIVRVVFTMIAVTLGIALLLQLRQRGYTRNPKIPVFRAREKPMLIIVGFIGGVFSGVAGIGIDIAVFILVVLLFRVCEKITTPTTVILMAIVSVVGFLCHVFITGEFTGQVVGFWIAAAPVVAVGAPLGAFICTKMSPIAVRVVLMVLLAVELVSTIAVVPMTTTTLVAAAVGLAVMSSICVVMVRSRMYATADMHQSRAPTDRGGANVGV